ncbi:hypothetical protein TorRG33x02_330030 [Trema orientale]|uniref:Uncharacterized protein n=1 Tax=Trema orientale TaxID=63057 RepID=A0A2P5B7X4_TREOI|nr:hypothetical protein TorRG33x02_330030 [Trema orientale]
MGNCGSFPKTKGDETEAPAPVLPKEESVQINNVEENVKVKEEEEKTITTDDHVDVNDVEKKDSDDHGETKPADDNNPQSLGSLLIEKKDENAEIVKTPEVSPEQKEEKEPIKAEKEEKTQLEKASEAASASITQ